MNEEKLTRKRSYPYEKEIDGEREKRFDFIKQTNSKHEEEEKDTKVFFEKLTMIKQRLNEVKSLLSDKDIADWNRHTAYMNPASTIVPYLREKLNIEIGTQAWTKMFEILSNFDLINSKTNEKWITLHLCEAPGAFISALNHFLITRKEQEKIDWQWYAQTLNPYYEHDQSTTSMLIDDDRLIFHSYDGNHWNFGLDNTGNLINQENIDYYISYFQPMGISFITADGSFDVQDNPAEQELLVYPLLKTEVHVGLSCLIAHGNFLLKIFTMFEEKTIELINLLYQTFRQISMFKPKTSKNGNSEIYIICLDFDREKFLNYSSENSSLSSSFLEQLIQCSQLFQTFQIETIENNLSYFENYHRRFNKKLQKIKSNYLDEYLDRCQVRELLPTDRHLLKSNLDYQRFNPNEQRLTRTGTFHNQHQRDRDYILNKIQNGFFCFNDSLCQILSEIIRNPTIQVEKIYIGELIARNEIKIDCIYGKSSNDIKHSCFCNRYLLELCHDIQTEQFDEFHDFQSIENLSPTDIPENELNKLQEFTRNYALEFQTKDKIYYIQSAPILTRLQASVIYVLTRLFHRTDLYIIRSQISSSFLLFIFNQFKPTNLNEFENVLSISSNSKLLQFIHIHQLLDEHFVCNLFQGNNFYLQLQYILKHD